MDKKTVLRVFGEAFLRSLVVLMAIAIIGFAVFFVIRVKADKDELAKSGTTEGITEEGSTYSDDELLNAVREDDGESSEDEITESITTEEEMPISSKDKKILVLNSTGVAGVAKKWMDKLTGEGFLSVETGNYSLTRDPQTKIYVAEEGMGEDLKDYFADADIEVGTLSSGVDVSTEGVEIFIVVGSKDTTVQ